ncbi:MAG: hypothetical protein IKG46_01930 [Solobacterium sp.]|nr:hypothetical protein [Solobacterium sp.]
MTAGNVLDKEMNRLKIPLVPNMRIDPASLFAEPILFSFCVSFIQIPSLPSAQPHGRMTILFSVVFPLCS